MSRKINKAFEQLLKVLSVKFLSKVEFANISALKVLKTNFVLLFKCHRPDGGLSKILVASEQLIELNEKLAVEKVAVTEKLESCEKLLTEIAERTGIATEKKQLALGKKNEIVKLQNRMYKFSKKRY